MLSPYSVLLLLPALTSAVTLDCNHIRADKQSFDLSLLGGPKTVHSLRSTPPSITNVTFTIDICAKLPRTPKVPKADECPLGTNICGIEYDYNPVDQTSLIRKVMPIAGEYGASKGRYLDPKVTRLKGGESHEDVSREGVRVELHGGKYPETRAGRDQKAIIEFVCDKKVTGNEGFEDKDAAAEAQASAVTIYEGMPKRAEKDDDPKPDDDDDDDPELPDMDKDHSLQFVSYRAEGSDSDSTDVLRLTWRTKYACEGERDNPSDEPSKSKKAGWGWFTWTIIVVFLLAASYIIFGSWLNYNRYGARGWDLIPHGDAIRDVPFAVKEWSGGMLDRLKGSGGSRGGYSAV